MYYTVNGRSLDDLIWQSLRFEGDVSPAATLRESAETAFGPPTLTTRARLTTRTLTLSVDVRPALMTSRPAVLDALTRRLAGVLEIVRSDAPERAWYGVLQQATATLPAGNLVNPLTVLDLTFAVPDPRRADRDTQTRALSATPVACPTGTGTSAPTVRLFGASTAVVDPAVVLRRPSGETVATLTLSGSLGADTWLDIDCGSEWLYLYTAGTRTNALAWLTGGAFPLLDGDDASGPDGPYPTLALTSASGTPTGLVLWRRSWQ
jgi:hypothetical protein